MPQRRGAMLTIPLGIALAVIDSTMMRLALRHGCPGLGRADVPVTALGVCALFAVLFAVFSLLRLKASSRH